MIIFKKTPRWPWESSTKSSALSQVGQTSFIHVLTKSLSSICDMVFMLEL
jgi:hypothetical protein